MADGSRFQGDRSFNHVSGPDDREPTAPVDGPLIGRHDKDADDRANVAYFRSSPKPRWSDLTQEEKGMDPYEPVVLLQAKPKKLEWVTKASETRQEFVTGSVRDSREGKGRYDLLPPYAIKRLAEVYERGGKRYGDKNWELGQPLTRFLDSALRHTFQVLEGKTDEDHAGQAAWNLLAFIEIQHRINEGLLPQELNDLG